MITTRTKTYSHFFAAAFLAVILARPVLAEVMLAPVFQDHMVLQRDMPVPIWGTAKPGEAVKVVFQTQTRETKADNEGKWKVALDALAANEQPQNLTVQGENKLELSDILVGEVWICSGQSNMELALSNVNDSYNEVQNANHASIRLYNVKSPTWTGKPYTQEDLDRLSGKVPFFTANWAVCGPERCQGFFRSWIFFRAGNLAIN